MDCSLFFFSLFFFATAKAIKQSTFTLLALDRYGAGMAHARHHTFTTALAFFNLNLLSDGLGCLANKDSLFRDFELCMSLDIELIQIFVWNMDTSGLVQDDEFIVFMFFLICRRIITVYIGAGIHILTNRFTGEHPVTDTNHAVDMAGDGTVVADDESCDVEFT